MKTIIIVIVGEWTSCYIFCLIEGLHLCSELLNSIVELSVDVAASLSITEVRSVPIGWLLNYSLLSGPLSQHCCLLWTRGPVPQVSAQMSAQEYLDRLQIDYS